MGETTRFAKACAAKLGYWRPVWIRCGLWVGIAMLTSLNETLVEFAAKGTVDWYEWTSAITKAILSGLIAWRLYLDQSYGNFKAEKERTGETDKFYNKLPP